MTDTRFTTVAEDLEDLLGWVDIDEVDDLETLLIVLFNRPISVVPATGVDEAAALEVTVWVEDLGYASTYEFPLSAMDLVRAFAAVVTALDLPASEGEEVPDYAAMSQDDLIQALQRGLGEVRLFNLLAEESDETSPSDLAQEPETGADPWVADLQSPLAADRCQSTVGFDDHPCEGDPAWYAEIEVWNQPVANPRWEGKVCIACLAGWREWADEEPEGIRVGSVHPIVAGD